MFATQDRVRCLAGARLIDRAGGDLAEARNLCASAEQIFNRAAAGAGGALALDAQDLTTLRLIVKALEGDATDALTHLRVAAAILRNAN